MIMFFATHVELYFGGIKKARSKNRRKRPHPWKGAYGLQIPHGEYPDLMA